MRHRGAHARRGRLLLGALATAPPEVGVFSRVTRRAQRHPFLVVVGVTALLVTLGLPFLSVRYKHNAIAGLPASFDSRRASELWAGRFVGGDPESIVIVARVSPADGTLAGWMRDIATYDGVRGIAIQPDPPPGLVVLSVIPDGEPQGETAQRLVSEVRAHRPPFPIYVSGTTAYLVDLRSQIAAGLPWALAVMAVVTVVLLFLMTGSILVPIKALVMNVLSLGASFGALVWVFQQGHLEGLLGFDANGAIELWVPVVVLVFAFGLSMDYEVFLLARVKESHDAGFGNDDAVAAGLQRSGRIITSASLLMVIVFAGFAAGQMLSIRQLGIALAIAVVVDATLVRCLLVPATMTLLGELNWWAPKALRRRSTGHDRGCGSRGDGPDPSVRRHR